jgi:uracil-DNA glycosylase
MSPTSSDINVEDMGLILPWLVDMGADEVLLDNPVDRFAAPPPEAPKPEKPVRATAILAPPPSRPAANWKAVAAGAEGLAAAEAIAAAIENLSDYALAIASFESHPLRKTASRAAALSGNLAADVLILCDKPRNDEDKSGDVLAGNNRVLAEKMLAAIGLSAFDETAGNAVALANFVPWRPPGNRAPTDQEAQMIVPFARKLVQLLKPKAILCFGSLPGQYLASGEDAIMRARGKWLKVEGVPMLPTFHPDTLLKSPSSKRLAWHDLLAFRQKLDELQ